MNNGFIQAKGGITVFGGNDGFAIGRIRIDCSKETINNIKNTNIVPNVGYFGEI